MNPPGEVAAQHLKHKERVGGACAISTPHYNQLWMLRCKDTELCCIHSGSSASGQQDAGS